MNCELCGKEVGEIPVILPIKRADGSLNTIACLKCAENSPVYCKKHEMPHLGFADNSTACPVCIEEVVVENRPKEISIFDRLQHELPNEEFNRLVNWAILSSDITGNVLTASVLRTIATKAVRTKQDITEVIEKIIETKSVSSILLKTE